ncbi:T9SS type A sorting domain-containing protein [Kaistella flava (ex Peng et al. 2021)]|uniref:T9SS type A sorting domain-containing protein n=1 Tax=Kaistella flava (ex Peng et al. 2021) TaxID=2038776 RepID=A0A7M2Y527_9FLAO|nr:T9SS type A sorting domain-containing protein [Kaistella flava (ex Peng et al. 2021)]QOW08959.1 T9SS type A sorting domain-containing protein [Kaistella flava (ex Peng et al. 2021)]
MKKIFTILAISALAITAQAQTTFNYILNNQGFANAQAITTGDIVAGKITYEALKNGASNAPSFYTAGGGTLRMYSENATGNGNSFSVKAVGTAKITSVKIKTSGLVGTDNYAPSTAIVSVDGVVVPTVYDPADLTGTYLITAATPASTITIKNGQTGTSAQIRILSVEVTYNPNLAVGDVKATKANLVKNTVVTNEIIFGEASKVSVFNMNGQVVKTADATENSRLNVSELPKGMYLVSGTVNGKAVSQKIIKK